MDELICRDCCVKKEATEFRPRRAGGSQRTLQCRACHCLAEKFRREAKRSRQHRQAINLQLARLKQAKSARQVGTVCEQLIGCFGGLEGFTTAWRACLEADLARCERRLKSAARGGRKVQRWGWVESTLG